MMCLGLQKYLCNCRGACLYHLRGRRALTVLHRAARLHSSLVKTPLHGMMSTLRRLSSQLRPSLLSTPSTPTYGLSSFVMLHPCHLEPWTRCTRIWISPQEQHRGTGTSTSMRSKQRRSCCRTQWHQRLQGRQPSPKTDCPIPPSVQSSGHLITRTQRLTRYSKTCQ